MYIHFVKNTNMKHFWGFTMLMTIKRVITVLWKGFISKTADLLGFSHTTISKVYREWWEKYIIYSERQLCGLKCLVDVRGQRRMGRLVRDGRKGNSNSNNHWLQPRYAEHHLWTYNTSNPGTDELQQQKTSWMPLMSAENRKRRLQFAQAHQNWTKEDCNMLPGLMSLDFCCYIQRLGSEFGVKNMKAWIHPALSQRFRLVVVV